jgi:hypothetical protein
LTFNAKRIENPKQMKKFVFLLFSVLFITLKSYSQNPFTPNDLIGTWDQNISKRSATIIFDDTSRVRFSYKGHTGSTRKYYYYLNNSQNPALLTVDYKAHRKLRNEYLIQMVDKSTIRLQVLHKHDDRTHFDEKNGQIITLTRRTPA